MRNKIYNSLLILALAVSAFGRQTQNATSDIDATRLRAHVEQLASDKFEGRRTGTDSAINASIYIADEFRKDSLRFGSTCYGSAEFSRTEAKEAVPCYAQFFPFIADIELGKNNAMLFTPRVEDLNKEGKAASLDLHVGEDWMPLGFSANGRVENARVVFVGYGITAADLKRDDYAGVDARGKIALAFAGTPDGDNPHGAFARFNDARFKTAVARDHGARSLVLIAREEDFKNDPLAHLQNDYTAGDAGIPFVVISRQTAERALTAGGLTTLADVERVAKVKSASAPLEHVAFSITVELVRKNAPAANVIGILEGSDAKLRNEAIIIGAHYDHLGRGGAGSLAARAGEIHHGADDNASGVAGLLELARIFATSPTKPRRTIIFIAFGGEEEGLLGSAYYVEHPAFPLAQTIAMINMDMIGRLRDEKLNIGGVGTAKEWRDLIARVSNAPDFKLAANDAKKSSMRDSTIVVPAVVGANGEAVFNAHLKQPFALTLNEDGYGPSDHSSFYKKQIPVLFFFTGSHDDYHKPTDTADKINYAGEARIVSFIADIVRAIDGNDARPVFTTAKSDSVGGGRTSFRVYLGTIPNYGESAQGLKLDGVRDASPAARAGLKAGDVIVWLAGRDIKNVYDYTYALGEMRAGVEYEIEVVRNGERLKFKITPTAR
jgi:aminopeptidase YwaD